VTTNKKKEHNAGNVIVRSSKKTQQNSRPDEEATSHHHALLPGVGRGRGVAAVAVVLAAADDCPGVQHGRRPRRTVAMAVRASSDGDGGRRPFRPRSTLLVTPCALLEKRCRHCRYRLLLVTCMENSLETYLRERRRAPLLPLVLAKQTIRDSNS
jgi:hypothetical protein